jgi:membrane fusion protein
MGLFRDAALQTHKQPLLGTIVLRGSGVFWSLSLGVLALVITLILLLIFGEYTRRAALNGYVVPDHGVVRIHAPSTGTVGRVMVSEGQNVEQGQALVHFSSERYQSDQTETSTALKAKVEDRIQSLRRVITQQRQLFAHSRVAAEVRIESLRRERQQLQKEKVTQQRLLAYAESTERRFESLAREGFVSFVAAQEKSEATTAHLARMESLARTALELGREISAVEAEIQTMPMREQTQLEELARALTAAEQELIDLDTRRAGLIVAPQGGRVSGLTAQHGQALAPERPLMTLIPEKAELEVHLFARSKDSGFVRSGQEVLIRFHPFPYQKFGHYAGTVMEVSGTPLLASELVYPLTPHIETNLLTTSTAAPAIDPMYRVRVRLEKDHVMAYGQRHELQPGMQLQGDVLLDTRTLLEWVLEPIYSLRGRYRS